MSDRITDTEIRKELDAIISMGYNSYKVYEDWIALMFHAFQRNDPAYLKVMGTYRNELPQGHREADHFVNATGALMRYMAATDEEVLGPLFMEYASNKNVGQYFTPLAVARTMAQITLTDMPEDRRFTIADPACGAGVSLIACAKEMSFAQNNRAIFIGQDIDLNCCRMCALNLMFFNLDGLVIWGNSLLAEVKQSWETKRSIAFGGSIKEADSDKVQKWLHDSLMESAKNQTENKPNKEQKKKINIKPAQMSLFE